MANVRAWLATVSLALGAAAVVLALPGAWPQPLPDGPLGSGPDADGAMAQLRLAAADVDAACRRGDLRAFAAVTTATYRRELDRGMAAVAGTVDAALLQELAAQRSCSDWFAGELLGGIVQQRRAVVALRSAVGAGSRLLAFLWDGRRWRFDGVASNAEAANAAAAAATYARERAERAVAEGRGALSGDMCGGVCGAPAALAAFAGSACASIAAAPTRLGSSAVAPSICAR